MRLRTQSLQSGYRRLDIGKYLPPNRNDGVILDQLVKGGAVGAVSAQSEVLSIVRWKQEYSPV